MALFSVSAEAFAISYIPSFIPCDPESERLGTFSVVGEPTPQFCAAWNPDFTFNGNKCCGKIPVRGSRKKRRVLNRCSPQRIHSGYCSEITKDQKEFAAKVLTLQIPDVLEYLQQENSKSKDQSFCNVNNGFLVDGKPIIPTEKNGIIVKSPERCLNYGTDAMVGMLEWVGRELGKFNSKARVLLGDVSGPRGGCLFGRSGRRGHASHTTGQDADIGFIYSNMDTADSGSKFIHHFDPTVNWWFLKKIFKNPMACIKVIFLDRKHIRSLAKYAKNDEEWGQFHRFIRHMPGHKNHFHVRVGSGPGQAGCGPDAKPELETEEDFDLEGDIFESEVIDVLKSRRGQ